MQDNATPLPVFNAKRVRQHGSEFFLDSTGQRLPSVSTILNATRPIEQRQALAQWRERVGSEAATQISSAASRRGTGTHKQLERYLNGETTPCPDRILPYWESLQPVLQQIEDVRLVEGTVLHEELGYAGKIDCVASFNGIPCLCEWKTADRPKQTLDRLNDYPLQLVAYWGAVNAFYEECGVNLQHGLLVIAVPDRPAETFWFEPELLHTYWQQWEARVAAYWRRVRSLPWRR